MRLLRLPQLYPCVSTFQRISYFLEDIRATLYYFVHFLGPTVSFGFLCGTRPSASLLRLDTQFLFLRECHWIDNYLYYVTLVCRADFNMYSLLTVLSVHYLEATFGHASVSHVPPPAKFRPWIAIAALHTSQCYQGESRCKANTESYQDTRRIKRRG